MDSASVGLDYEGGARHPPPGREFYVESQGPQGVDISHPEPRDYPDDIGSEIYGEGAPKAAAVCETLCMKSVVVHC